MLPGKRSLRSLLVKLTKIGAKVVKSGRDTTFQMAEVVVSRDVFAEILARISRLRCCTAQFPLESLLPVDKFAQTLDLVAKTFVFDAIEGYDRSLQRGIYRDQEIEGWRLPGMGRGETVSEF